MTPAERALARAVLWMSTGAAAGLPLLVVPEPDDPFLTFIVQLSVLVLFGTALTFHLAPLADETWFAGASLGPRVRTGLGGVMVVIVVTGAVGLVTLATSAALRFDVSLQFLQLISAMDIAWVVAALVLGLRWRFGRRLAVGGALVMGAVCVWSIWRYLDVVGFTPEGGWLVDGARIASLVLPFDLMAAVLAVGAFVSGAGRAD